MSDLLVPILVGLTFLVAGAVKGVIGLGLPTVAIGLLVMVMTPAQAAALLVVPTLATNLWQLAGAGLTALLRRLWTMLLGICVGIWLGAGTLAGDTSGRAAAGLGAALIAFAILGLSPWRLSVPPRAEPWLSPLIGLATGLVTAATGVFAIPSVPYLQALGLDKDALVQALGISFTVATLALGADLVRTGVLEGATAATSLAALAPALIGMALGQWLRNRIRAELFRVCFLVALIVLGSHLLLRAAL
jgi:uncharacterized membrane protein YfcA